MIQNFNLDTKSIGEIAAKVIEPASGRFWKSLLISRGYSLFRNFLDGTITGKAGQVYNQYAGFCLETQHFPIHPIIRTFRVPF
jgi:aldose 1-epimerase